MRLPPPPRQPMTMVATVSLARASTVLSLLLALTLLHSAEAVKVIENGIAPPEIVHTPVELKPRCIVHADPLDLVIVLDSSGSLRNKFQDEIEVIRRIARHVTIGAEATRVMLIQFSGTQHLEFAFGRFSSRDALLGALGVLRHVSGITRIGGALEFARHAMLDPAHGMRDDSVPKVVFLLSDGRTHDFPKDLEESAKLRAAISGVNIWAYGTGEYVAMPALLNYTQDASKIITNRNLGELEPLFEKWRGSEVCEKVPVCIKGSDKPLDLALLIDSSESVDSLFAEQLNFAIERIVQNVNVHPEAVRMALITFSGSSFIHYTFNSFRIVSNTAVIRHLNTLRSIKGTTSTHLALSDALHMFTTGAEQSGARPNATKLVVVLTDGHSQRPPGPMADRLRAAGAHVIAVSMKPKPSADEQELLAIAGNSTHVFTPSNLGEFEAAFFKFVGFGCNGMELGADPKPQIRGATEVACDADSLTFSVRTQRPMRGVAYAIGHSDDEECRVTTDGSTRDVSIRIHAGTCGLARTASLHGTGYAYNVTIILQFHPLIVTRADQGLDVSCFHSMPVAAADSGARAVRRPVEHTQCSYRLHKYNSNECVALDAKVGETLHHKWECDSAENMHYLVHDCFVRSERHAVKFIDTNGCQMDEFFLETPKYDKFGRLQKNGGADAASNIVHQAMSVFKFADDSDLVFECALSLCDMDSGASCTRMIPPKCANSTTEPVVDMGSGEFAARHRQKRAISEVKDGFLMTIPVVTRTLNVLDSESMRPRGVVKYCDIH